MDIRISSFIVDACKLIASEPFSFRELQARTGVRSAKTIYRWLRELQEDLGQTCRPNAERVIVDFVIHDTWKTLAVMIEEEYKRLPIEPLDLFRAFLRRVVVFFWDDPHRTILVTRCNPSWAVRNPRSFTKYQREVWERLQDIFRRAQSKGLLTNDIDADLLLRLIYGGLHQALYGMTLRNVMNERYTQEQVIAGIEILLERLGDGGAHVRNKEGNTRLALPIDGGKKRPASERRRRKVRVEK